MSTPHTLYLTVDGVLQPLGYSQVCRVLLGLVGRGFGYELLSLESRADLADLAGVRKVREELGDHGIGWSYLPYDPSGTPRAAAANLLQLARKAYSLVSRGSVGLVHARAYHAALVALATKRALAVPYLFDARGRWIDERLLGGRWFTNRWVEASARAVERRLYRSASGVVVLTQLHGDDIVAGDFGAYNGVPIKVVTTCADFDSFSLEARFGGTAADRPVIPAEISARLAGKLVIGLVGSTNAFYRHEESFALARRILALRADAHLLLITAQRRELATLAEQAGISPERMTLVTAPHQAMPAWLSRIDWAIQLLNSGVAKRGSMPTKLAEFFASGVRPVHFGCNEEVSAWVERAGSGLVLRSLEPDALTEAAQFVATSPTPRQLLECARSRTETHFALAAGLSGYEDLLRKLEQRAPSSPSRS